MMTNPNPNAATVASSTPPSTRPEETAQALEESIAHWWRMHSCAPSWDGEQPTGVQCALCRRFMNTCKTADGEICPVRQETGYVGCHQSPFYDAAMAFKKAADRPASGDAQFMWVDRAKKMILFLEALR